MDTDGMSVKKLAAEIDGYLRRFEADPVINAKVTHTTYGETRSGTITVLPYYQAGAVANGRWVSIAYVSYQGRDNLKREDASRYLEWLRAGNIGKHWEAGK